MRYHQCPNCRSNMRVCRRMKNKDIKSLIELTAPLRDSKQSETREIDVCYNCGLLYTFSTDRIKEKKFEMKILGKKIKGLELEDYDDDEEE